MDELIKVEPSKLVVMECDCKKKGTAVLHPSVASGWLVGTCSSCGKKLVKKEGVK